MLGLQSQMARCGPRDRIGVLLEHNLNRAASGIACIGHRNVSRLQLEPTQALGLMSIRDGHFLGSTAEQVITPMQSHVVTCPPSNTKSSSKNQQDAISQQLAWFHLRWAALHREQFTQQP